MSITMDHTYLHTKPQYSPVPVKRITVSMPEYVYDRLQQLPKGTISQFVTEGVQEKFIYPKKLAKKTKKQKQFSVKAISEFIELTKEAPLPNMPWPEMKKLMRKGLA
ncbi:hypothetical protein KJ628_00205 [Patescibacteria group bacterium]|nr:hypothetical protein [Patescibacteria group bacterium]